MVYQFNIRRGNRYYINDIHIKSENEAIVVGDNGIIYVTHDGYRTWTQLSKDYINGGGTGEYLIGDTSNNKRVLQCPTIIHSLPLI